MPVAVASAAQSTPVKAHCSFKVISYRFVGPRGTSFRYAGRSFTISDKGFVELIAERNEKHYMTAGEVKPIDHQLPADPFGSVTVNLGV